MRRLLGVVLFIAGCYQPRVPLGIACSGDGVCPDGQSCVAGTCQPPGTLAPDAASDGAVRFDATADAPIDAPPMWAAPTPVPGVNNAGSTEDDPSWTPDRLTIVFTSDRVTAGSSDIFLGTRASTADSFVVAPLDALNSAANEASPEITADGATIYFTSDRVTAGSRDVYVSHRTNNVWSAPVVTELSTTSNEGDVAISPDQLTAMIARSGKLYLATRASTADAFGTPAVVPSIAVANTSVAAPSITNNADAVYFHAGSVRDLYYARRAGDAYTTPAPITELNTATRDDGPFISPDEHHLLYGHDGDIYETSR